MVQQVAGCLRPRDRPRGLQRSPNVVSKVSFVPCYKAAFLALGQQVGAKIPRGETIKAYFTLAFRSGCPAPSSLHARRAQGQNTVFWLGWGFLQKSKWQVAGGERAGWGWWQGGCLGDTPGRDVEEHD